MLNVRFVFVSVFVIIYLMTNPYILKVKLLTRQYFICYFSFRGNENSEDVYNMLKKNFDTAYHGLTRAPFGLYVHAAWFFGYDYRYEGYKKFLDDITQLDDVWIVPIQAGIAYRKAPLTNDEILGGGIPEFHCDNFPIPSEPCRPNSCP